MSDLPVLNIGSEQDSADTLLERILTRTDIKIIEATAQISLQTGETPTASDILREFAKTNSLKKTQLYERLNRLTRLGFISARILPRPRKYITNYNTITEGVERWIEEQMTLIADLSSGLESFSIIVKRIEPRSIVSAITKKLSIDITSNTG